MSLSILACFLYFSLTPSVYSILFFSILTYSVLKISTFFIFSVLGIYSILLQCNTSNASILALLAFSTVQVSAPYRTTFYIKLFINDFLISKLTLFEVKRFFFLQQACLACAILHTMSIWLLPSLMILLPGYVKFYTVSINIPSKTTFV